MMADRWDPTEFAEWLRLARDILSYLLAAFLILYGTLHAAVLGVTILATLFATAAAFLGTPATLRMDRKASGDGSP